MNYKKGTRIKYYSHGLVSEVIIIKKEEIEDVYLVETSFGIFYVSISEENLVGENFL